MLTANGHRIELLAAFAVKGEPIGKQRPRVVRRGGKTHTYTPQKTKTYEQRIAWTTASQRNLREPPIAKSTDALFVRSRAIFTRPKYLLKRPAAPRGLILKTTAPDADNVAKAIGDGLEKSGIVTDNDARFAGIECWKYWAEIDGPGARTEIEIYRVLDMETDAAG
jgi:Holliday junction resolvase RusA-like endonuclease